MSRRGSDQRGGRGSPLVVDEAAAIRAARAAVAAAVDGKLIERRVLTSAARLPPGASRALATATLVRAHVLLRTVFGLSLADTTIPSKDVDPIQTSNDNIQNTVDVPESTQPAALVAVCCALDPADAMVLATITNGDVAARRHLAILTDSAALSTTNHVDPSSRSSPTPSISPSTLDLNNLATQRDVQLADLAVVLVLVHSSSRRCIRHGALLRTMARCRIACAHLPPTSLADVRNAVANRVRQWIADRYLSSRSRTAAPDPTNITASTTSTATSDGNETILTIGPRGHAEFPFNEGLCGFVSELFQARGIASAKHIRNELLRML